MISHITFFDFCIVGLNKTNYYSKIKDLFNSSKTLKIHPQPSTPFYKNSIAHFFYTLLRMFLSLLPLVKTFLVLSIYIIVVPALVKQPYLQAIIATCC